MSMMPPAAIGAPDSTRQARRVFFLVLAITTLARTALAISLPLTGDEAYFLAWGRAPDWGFYDHPPMVGWWLAVLDAISSRPLILRLPALLVPLVLAGAVVLTVRRHGEESGWLAGILLLLAPINLWNVAITTDVPLMLFAGLAALAYARAQRTGAAGDFILCGLALGGALLSKYFAGLLAIAIFLHSVWRPSPRKLVGLALIVLACLPAAALQIAWNALNCWPNVMFNIVNRHDNAGLSWLTPLLFFASAVYVISPPIAWAFLRLRTRRRVGRARAERALATTAGHGRADGLAPPVVPADEEAGQADAAGLAQAARLTAHTCGWLALAPLLILAVLSLVKTIGLHWLASFTVPAVVWFVLSSAFDRHVRHGALRFGAGFALLHYVLIAVIIALPIETWSGWKRYPGLIMTTHAAELADAIGRERLDRYVLASNGYSSAVTLEYNFDRRVLVFGTGSSHARHDDIRSDFRSLDGRDFLIVRKNAFREGEYDAFFEHVTSETLIVRGAQFTIVTGLGFRYPAYRDQVLEQIRQLWYQVPDWLPRGACYFCDRYFPERACHR